MRYLRFIPVLLVLLDACVDPLPLELSSSSARIVVDGMITNEPGPYRVKLIYSSNLENSMRLPIPITGASVWIKSSLNESVLLSEISPGIYESSPLSIQGQIGVSYHVKIVTSTGAYESTPQTMVASGTIDAVYPIFSAEEIDNGDETLDAFNIYIDSHGNEGDPNLYRWRWTGVFKARAFPELYTVGDGDINPITPAPWPCSGYIYESETLQKVKDCECCICWSYNYSTSALASDTRFIQNNEFKKIEMGKVGITPMNFYERYHVEVEQLSVSEEVHNFWKLVAAQQKALGSLFQPNAVKVRGNLKCISDPNEEVLGIFSVSAVSRKSIFIDPEDIPYALAPIDTVTIDCRIGFKNATTEKPLFW